MQCDGIGSKMNKDTVGYARAVCDEDGIAAAAAAHVKCRCYNRVTRETLSPQTQ